jgi:hypothetical protein
MQVRDGAGAEAAAIAAVVEFDGARVLDFGCGQDAAAAADMRSGTPPSTTWMTSS